MQSTRQIEILTNIRTKLELNEYRSCLLGLCQILHNLKDLTESERREMKCFLIANKPTTKNEFKEFTNNKYWVNSKKSIKDEFWWLPMYRFHETRQVRIAYIEALIKSVK